MTHGQIAHLQTMDGHALSTSALHEAARLWHEAHDEPAPAPPRTSSPRDLEPRVIPEQESARVEVIKDDDLLTLAIKRHGGKNPFL